MRKAFSCPARSYHHELIMQSFDLIKNFVIHDIFSFKKGDFTEQEASVYWGLLGPLKFTDHNRAITGPMHTFCTHYMNPCSLTI